MVTPVLLNTLKIFLSSSIFSEALKQVLSFNKALILSLR